MCLGIPMKILKMQGDSATVSVESVRRRINIGFLTRPKRGDYVIVHAGFAIEKIDPKKARETLRLLKGIG